MWDKIFFEDFIELQRGFDLPEQAREEGEFPVIASTNIVGYHNEFKVHPPCVVTGRSGSLGFVQLIEKPCFPLNTTLFVKDFKGNHPRFVYYFLKTLKLERYNSGVGVPTLNRNDLDKIEIKIPPLPVQCRIADILGRYDVLIENYQQQIGLLEASARELYREWFVRGRCPYALAQQTNKETVARLEELVTTQYGFTASSSEENTGVKFLRITDISGNRIDWDNVPFCEVSDEDFGKYELKVGDIVVARIGATAGYARRINKRHPKAVFASYLVRMQVMNPLHDYYVGMTIESQLFKNFINQTVGGAAQPQANAPLLTSYELRLPSDESLSAFNTAVEAIFDLIENLQLQIIQLRQMRDKLLPRLMSGQLEVAGQTTL